MKRKETSSVQTFDCQNVFPKPEEDKSKSTRTKKAFAACFTQEKARYIKKVKGREREREKENQETLLCAQFIEIFQVIFFLSVKIQDLLTLE